MLRARRCKARGRGGVAVSWVPGLRADTAGAVPVVVRPSLDCLAPCPVPSPQVAVPSRFHLTPASPAWSRRNGTGVGLGSLALPAKRSAPGTFAETRPAGDAGSPITP